MTKVLVPSKKFEDVRVAEALNDEQGGWALAYLLSLCDTGSVLALVDIILEETGWTKSGRKTLHVAVSKTLGKSHAEAHKCPICKLAKPAEARACCSCVGAALEYKRLGKPDIARLAELLDE